MTDGMKSKKEIRKQILKGLWHGSNNELTRSILKYEDEVMKDRSPIGKITRTAADGTKTTMARSWWRAHDLETRAKTLEEEFDKIYGEGAFKSGGPAPTLDEMWRDEKLRLEKQERENRSSGESGGPPRPDEIVQAIPGKAATATAAANAAAGMLHYGNHELQAKWVANEEARKAREAEAHAKFVFETKHYAEINNNRIQNELRNQVGAAQAKAAQAKLDAMRGVKMMRTLTFRNSDSPNTVGHVYEQVQPDGSTPGSDLAVKGLKRHVSETEEKRRVSDMMDGISDWLDREGF